MFCFWFLVLRCDLFCSSLATQSRSEVQYDCVYVLIRVHDEGYIWVFGGRLGGLIFFPSLLESWMIANVRCRCGHFSAWNQGGGMWCALLTGGLVTRIRMHLRHATISKALFGECGWCVSLCDYNLERKTLY